uniref:U1-poneritoxin-Da2a n=1 Tax=Dinoponera australis TaxID=609289 RepID=TX2A_DINAS|nr:RecName: Full=U1-poneritoxin-Da2a; Short=U1-PONTX-Da2a; AltName: Full=Dinoponeratoxin Da-1837; AltName: Full=Poneratoxin [Dinoponera australis]
FLGGLIGPLMSLIPGLLK